MIRIIYKCKKCNDLQVTNYIVTNFEMTDNDDDSQIIILLCDNCGEKNVFKLSLELERDWNEKD